MTPSSCERLTKQAAITNPDPVVSNQARDFFVRHMRVLEECIKVWHMHDVIVQINALREAFTADMSKPFELKANFPSGSPLPVPQSSPPLSQVGYPLQQQHIGNELGQMEQQQG